MKLTNIYYFVLAEKRCMAFAVRVGVNMSKSVSASSQNNKCVCVIALRMFFFFFRRSNWHGPRNHGLYVRDIGRKLTGMSGYMKPSFLY